MKKKNWFSPFYITLVLLIMYLPILVVVAYSFNESRYGAWTGFSLQWYKELFNNRYVGDALGNSLLLAVLSCGAAVVIGTMGALGMAKSHFKGKGILENVSIMPMMIPEIIMGMAYLVFFSFIKLPGGMLSLVIAHTVFCVPYIYINVQSRLVGLDPSFVEAARDLGATPAQALRDITLPLIAPAVASGTLLAFAMSMDDVIISFFVSGTNTNTLPVYIYSMLKMGVSPSINALCTLILGALLLILAGWGLWQKYKNRRFTPEK